MANTLKNLFRLVLLFSALLSFVVHSDCISDHAEELLEECREIPIFIEYSYSEAQHKACLELVQFYPNIYDAHFYLGRLLYHNAMPEEADKAFRAGYDAGSTKAALAYAFVNGGQRTGGLGIATDTTRAIYQDMADKGDPVAKVLLGIDLTESDTIPAVISEQDKAAAFNLFEQAAKQGYPMADYYLGRYYRHFCPDSGENCEAKAIEHFRKAATGGVRSAAEILDAYYGEEIYAFGPLSEMLYQYTVPMAIVLRRP